jgi:plastocyanin
MRTDAKRKIHPSMKRLDKIKALCCNQFPFQIHNNAKQPTHKRKEETMHRHLLVIAATLIGLILAAARPVPVEAASKSAVQEVTFETVGMGFMGPDSIPAGLTSVRIVNKGTDLHHIQLLRLADGKTAEDFSATVKTAPFNPMGPAAAPAWVKFVGGPNGVIPGESATAILNLEPGNYVLICFIPDSKGVAHIALGMVKALKVTGTTDSKAPEPVAAINITAMDFNFAIDKPIAAGTQTIRFTNAGTQPHEVLVVQLPPDKTIKDFAAAFEPGHSGPPPGKPIGGMTGIEKGGHAFFTAKFEPGRYGLICFFMDGTKKVPHFALGMTNEFTIK